MSGTFDYRMKLGSHAIFSGVTATKSQHFPKSFLNQGGEHIPEIHGFGLSPELCYYQDCNMLAFCDADRTRRAAYKILIDLLKLQQTCSVSDVRSNQKKIASRNVDRLLLQDAKLFLRLL